MKRLCLRLVFYEPLYFCWSTWHYSIDNGSYKNSHYPKSWKTGMIVNLFKDDNACDPNNYRGLTINSCLGKVFNSVINNRLIEFLFKRKARTSDHIFIVNALIQKYRKNKEHLYMCFIDFKKAFDSVWHLALKLKLLEYGISGKFYDIIDNMYKDNLNCIKSDGQLSNTFFCARGVKQGDILSPNLFNLYINDLPNKLGIDVDTPELNGEPINCLLYADDLIIFSRTREGLQNKLNILDSYCEEWCLSVNPKKTKIMYTGKNSGESAPFMVGDASLEYTSHYKYLGVEINANNKVAEAVQNLCTRSWKAIFKLNSILAGTDIPAPHKLSLFDKLVKPILLYSSESWGYILDKCVNTRKTDACNDIITTFWRKVSTLPIETVHTRFCKGALGIHRKATNIAVMGELGRLPMTISVIKAMLKFWQHTTDHNYANTTLKKSVSARDGAWFDSLNNIYNIFGWHWHGSAPTNNDINRMIAELTQSYKDHWYKSVHIEGGSKLSIFKLINKKFLPEPYLYTIRCKKNQGGTRTITPQCAFPRNWAGQICKTPNPGWGTFLYILLKEGQ